MAKRDIAVIGLGRFGRCVCKTYYELGGNVIAIDSDKELVDMVADYATTVAEADVMDIEVLDNIGVGNMDVAVIAMADHLEASIMAIIGCKEAGVPYVICKAKNEQQKLALEKVGADEVVFPENEMGIKTAKNIFYGSFTEVAVLSDDISIIEVNVPEIWAGKTLVELNLRKKYGFNVLATKDGGDFNIGIEANDKLEAGMVLVILGKNEMFKKVFKK